MTAWVNAISTAVVSIFVLAILAVACQFLPNSPFQVFVNGTYFGAIAPYIPYIRYFVPIDEMILILEVWLTGIMEYWLWRLIYGISKSVSSSGTSLIPMKK